MPEYSAKILGALWFLCSYAQAASLSSTLTALHGDLWLSPPSTEPAINKPFVASGPTYDVSSNQVVRVESATGLNSHWVGHWVTTTDRLHFILITFTDVVGGGGTNGCLVYSLETGSSNSSYTSYTPTTIGQERLKIQFGEQYALQSLTDDNISAIIVVANYTESDFSLNTTFQPRGSLLFNGGSGSFFWGSDFNQGRASPAAYTTGTFTLNRTAHTIDSNRSTTWYDHQWGNTTPTQGWHWFPIQLDNGIRISAWVLPTDKGSTIRSFATACIQMAGKKWSV